MPIIVARKRGCCARDERKRCPPIVEKRDSEQHIVEDGREKRHAIGQGAAHHKQQSRQPGDPCARSDLDELSRRAARYRRRAKRNGTAMMLTRESMELNQATGT